MCLSLIVGARKQFLFSRIRNMPKRLKRPLTSAENNNMSILQFVKKLDEPQDVEQSGPSSSTKEKDVEGGVKSMVNKTVEDESSIEPPTKKIHVESKASGSSVANTYKAKVIAGLHDPKWLSALKSEFERPHMTKLFNKLDAELKQGNKIYPPIDLVFNAFNLTPLNKIRVVIIGQDPYHNVGQAHGLSFSVPAGVPPPPSLLNIYKELAKEFPPFVAPKHGSLVNWAKQGVFMLNASLTVRANNANSHKDFGWQEFTDNVIKMISDKQTGVVFLLWGNFAQKKSQLVNQKKHEVVKTAHPSPLSYRLFVDCKCFTKVNDALKRLGREPIDWTNL
ncbi:hypothetical protein M3Y94_00850700 [Aphelenchoides besseyi]|nr:hypothetical protein M3Y94_00850700 [Aphelenchoides besseyi]KAI6226834.1 Uracil-DNA glycosylase [Aphelenchoides besseyi]